MKDMYNFNCLFFIDFIVEFFKEWFIMKNFDNLVVVYVKVIDLEYFSVIDRIYREVGKREIVKVRVVI